MKNLLSSFAIMLISVTIMMCSGENNHNTIPENEPASIKDKELIDCPGCNMRMEKSKMVAHVLDGDTLYFCAEGCRDHYLALREKQSLKKSD